jgi:predicted Zn-dependent peptidase
MDNIKSIKMDNGLKVTYCLMPHMRSVSTVIGVKAGSLYEKNNQQGISHFIEHMLFKGTKQRKNTLEISQCIEQLGGEINASTSEECTFIYSKVLYKNFASAFEVMADIINNSLFREEDLVQEKAIVIEEINKYQDIPEDWITFLINRLMWKDTVLGNNVLGEKETVKKFNREALLQYFQERYQPQNMIISITGNISPKKIEEVLGKYPFLNKNRLSGEVPSWEIAQNQSPELELIAKKVNQAHLCFGFEGVSRFHQDKIAMDLLNIILGAGLSSRLFQEIRVKEGLAYDIHSYAQYFHQTGSFNIYAGVIPDKLIHSIQKILAELRKIKETRVSHSELKKAKEMYKGGILMELENTLSHAFHSGSYSLLYNKEYNYREIIGQIEKVQPEDIKKIAVHLFQDHKIKLVVFSPPTISIDKNSLLSILKI